MKREICLDANIFVACFVAERDHDMCLNLLSILRERDFVFYEPALVGFEVTSVLRRKVWRGEITKAQSEQALHLFFDLPLLLQWQPQILTKALKQSHATAAKNAYDTSYLAVALERNIPCVTLDEDFFKRARKIFKKLRTVPGCLDDLRQVSSNDY